MFFFWLVMVVFCCLLSVLLGLLVGGGLEMETDNTKGFWKSMVENSGILEAMNSVGFLFCFLSSIVLLVVGTIGFYFTGDVAFGFAGVVSSLVVSRLSAAYVDYKGWWTWHIFVKEDSNGS